MDWAREIVLEITTASQRVVSAATSYARRRGSKNVQPCHFRLEKEMQKISVAARGVLDVLDKASLPDGPPLDDRLEEWFSTDELPMSLDTLNQMERILRGDPTWMGAFVGVVNVLRFAPPEDKIDVAVKLFDSRKNYFHFLLTTEVWNCEEPQQQKRQQRAPLGDELAIANQLVPRNIITMDVDLADNTTLNATNKAAVTDENETKHVNNLRKIDIIVRWLNGLTCAAKQKETLSLRQPDTCTWLDSTPEYKSWINSNDSFLWLQGKPGSGKTVLASYVVNSIKNKVPSDTTLIFFYCDFRNDRSTSACEVMRSLLSQLLHHIRNGNVDPGELLDSLVAEKESDIPILEDIERLASFVSQASKYFTHQPLVVVDALDECKEVEKLLVGLIILDKGGMRLFVTSRPVQIIKDELRGLPFVSMDKMTRAVSTDIALHVTRELDTRRRLRDLESEMKSEIRSALCDGAQGMFRWVQCQIDTLNQCATNTEVREALNNLPIGLDETYRRILVAIDTRSPMGKLALRALVWLVGALRPLRLSEIHEALTLDVERRTMNPDMGPMHRGALLDACSSLVTYNEDDTLILSHFSVKEYLTGDLTRSKLPRYHVNLQDAHQSLARSCICFITLYLQHVHGSRDESSLSSILHIINERPRSGNPSTAQSMPQECLDYVFTTGFNHLAFLGSANRVVLNDVLTLQSAIQQYRNAWANICRMLRRHRLSVPWPDGEHDIVLYILIAFASESLLRVYLDQGRNLVKPKDQTNPLVYAAYFGKLPQAQTLLSHGVKVNEKGLVVDASHLALPLQVAVSRQHDDMVDLLLSSGSVVPTGLFSRCRDRNFPIRILRRLFETDEFVEWAAEPGNILPSPVGLLERRPPLIYERDIIIMTRRLIQVGVDPGACNSSRKTALEFALEGEYHAIVLYLLIVAPFPSDFLSMISRITCSERVRLIVDAGIDVHVDDTEDTTLHLILRYLEEGESLDAINMFVDGGCNPFVRNAIEKTPLHLALEQGNFSVANYLLSLGTLSDVLSIVVESRCQTTWKLETIRTLIGREEDVCGIMDYRGDTPLHQAMRCPDPHEGLQIAKLLVCAGCDPFKRGVERKTAFDLALDRGLLALADYLHSAVASFPPDSLFSVVRSELPLDWRVQATCALVRKGIDALGLSSSGETLLHAVVLSLDEDQGLDVAKLFVDAGGDPFRRNMEGLTPFRMALDRKFSLLSDFLLSTGGFPPSDDLLALLRCELPAGWRARTICSLIHKGVCTRGFASNCSLLLRTAILSLNEDQCLDVMKTLVGTGFSLSDDRGTLLHAAVQFLKESDGLDITRLLVSAGCDFSTHDKQGKTSIHIAAEKGYISVVEYLLSLGRLLPDDILFSALRAPYKSQAPVLRMLIESGANARVCMDGSNLLHIAMSSYTRPEDDLKLVVQILVDSGCDPSLPNSHGKTPLHLAVAKGWVSIVVYFLMIQALPCFPIDILTSAFDERVPNPRGTCSVIQLLIRKGANVHIQAAKGITLLHLAIRKTRCPSLCPIAIKLSGDVSLLHIVKMLVDAGCDPSTCDADGRQPVFDAMTKGYIDVEEYLLPRTESPLENLCQNAMDSAPWLVRIQIHGLLKKEIEHKRHRDYFKTSDHAFE